jgi:hypothetical protein
MCADSLNLRRTVLNCSQLTPTIALSVVSTMSGYRLFHNDKGKQEVHTKESYLWDEKTEGLR